MGSIFLRPWVLFYLIPFIGGLFYSLGFPMNGIPHFMGFSFLGILLLFLSLSLPYSNDEHKQDLYQRSLKAKLLTGLLFCAGHCLSGYYWIPYTLHEFGQIPFPLNTMLGLLFSVIIMPQLLFYILILHVWGKFNLKSSKLAGNIYTRNVLLALLFTMLDRFVPQQFPAHIGHTWLQLAPHLGLAKVFGVPVYSFMSYWFILSIVSYWRVKKWDFLAMIAFTIFLLVNFLIPLQWHPEQDKNPTRLRLVQANIGNFMKLKSENGDTLSVKEIYQRYQKLSTKVGNAPVDLIIWPETAYPQLLNSAMLRINPYYIPQLIQNTARQAHAQLFFGGYDKSKSVDTNFYETEYNAAFLINKDGEYNDVYHKQLLIPFGEGLPFGPLNPLLAKIIKNISYFARGDRFTKFTLENKKSFITAICYEILFSDFIRKFLNHTAPTKEAGRPDFLINLTNDSWYGDTSEPFQHQFLSHWRALEFQIPIVRMTNTGISSILYPDGSESKRLKLFSIDSLDIDLHTPQREPTIWQQFGFASFMSFAIVCFILSIFVETFVTSKKE